MKYELKEKQGTAAIWLNVFFEEENDLIGWYDHDNSEGSSLDTETALEEQFESYSYGKSFRMEAAQSAVSLNVKSPSYAFILFDYETDMKPGLLSQEERTMKGVKADKDAVFLGHFSYKKSF